MAPQVREHVADGIEEYDNPLPRWWVHLFIGSIVFAIVYSVLYPSLWFWGGALNWSSTRQHAQEVADARTMYEAASESAAARIDLEQLSKDPVAIAEGQVTFSQYCAPCHGARGEGGIGLRLYGPTWKWGGDSKTMLTTIRFGRPPSVMPAWGKQMPLEKIAQVGAFVYSLRYTAPKDASATAPAGAVTPTAAPAAASPAAAPAPASPAPAVASPIAAPSATTASPEPAAASPAASPVVGAPPVPSAAGASPAPGMAPATAPVIAPPTAPASQASPSSPGASSTP